MIAFKSGVGFDYYEGRLSPVADNRHVLPEQVDLILNGATTVKIQTVEAGNKPVPGVTLTPIWVMKPGKTKVAASRVAWRPARRIKTESRSSTSYPRT